MLFSYDLTTDIGQVRLEIGDTSDVTGKGVKPDGTYLRDDEIQFFLTREGSVGRASAAACEVLARMYARFVDITVGPRREALNQASAAYLAQAKELRGQYGGGGARKAIAGSIIKMDGFNTDETASDAVTLAGSEYGPTAITVYLDY